MMKKKEEKGGGGGGACSVVLLEMRLDGATGRLCHRASVITRSVSSHDSRLSKLKLTPRDRGDNQCSSDQQREDKFHPNWF